MGGMVLEVGSDRNATRKVVVEGGCVQTRMCDTAWSNEKKLWQGLRHGEPQTAPLSVMLKVRNHDPKGVGEMGTMQRAKMSKEGLEMAQRNRVAPLP